MKRNAFRKKFFNSGLYSFMSKGLDTNNSDSKKESANKMSIRDKHATIFGTIGENRKCPTGVITFNY